MYRTNHNKVIMGVLGGISDTLGVDAIFLRLFYFIFSLINPLLGLFIYLLLAFIIPEKPKKNYK